MAAALGVHVTLVEKRPRLLDFVDDEMVEALQYHLRGLGLSLRLGEEVDAVRRSPQGVMTHLEAASESPPRWCCTRRAARAPPPTLNLEAAGLEADSRGRIEVGPTTAHPSRTSSRRVT